MPHEWLKQASPSARLKLRIRRYHEEMLDRYAEIEEPRPNLFKGQGHPVPKKLTFIQRLQALLP